MTTRRDPLALAALCVALLALLVALAGGGYAAAKISGAELKKKSVAGSKLKNDTLTGVQVKESTLKGLAAATDFRRIRFERTVTGDSNAVTSQVLNLGALQLGFTCTTQEEHWELTARSLAGNTGWDLATNRPTSSHSDGGIVSGTAAVIDTAGLGAGGWGREVGTVVFNNNARRETITVSFAVFISGDDDQVYCNLAGTAVRTAS